MRMKAYDSSEQRGLMSYGQFPVTKPLHAYADTTVVARMQQALPLVPPGVLVSTMS